MKVVEAEATVGESWGKRERAASLCALRTDGGLGARQLARVALVHDADVHAVGIFRLQARPSARRRRRRRRRRRSVGRWCE